jgi:hypothetical protein
MARRPERKRGAPTPVIKCFDVLLRNKVGSPLVVYNFSNFSGRRDIQGQRNDPKALFLAARYVDEKKQECIPAMCIKHAMVAAASFYSRFSKGVLRQSFMVSPVTSRESTLIPLENHKGKPAKGVMREDVVRSGNNPILIYRPLYERWQIRVRIEFNSRLVLEEQLRALLVLAGWGVGTCEGRPERGSTLGWGRFEVVTE